MKCTTLTIHLIYFNSRACIPSPHLFPYALVVGFTNYCTTHTSGDWGWFSFDVGMVCQVYWAAEEVFVLTDGSFYFDTDCIAEYVIGSHPTDADSWICEYRSWVSVSIEDFAPCPHGRSPHCWTCFNFST